MYQETDLVKLILSKPTIAQLDIAIDEARLRLKSKLLHLPRANLEKHRKIINQAQEAIIKLDKKVDSLEENLLPLLFAYKQDKLEQESSFNTNDIDLATSFDDESNKLTEPQSPISSGAGTDREEYSEMKLQYLKKAREISTQDIYIEYEVAADLCTVSKSALLLVDLAMQILSEAEFDENTYRQIELYNVVKKIIDMYIIIVPVKFENNLRTDTRAITLLHDSLMFIAQFVMSSPQIKESPIDFSDIIQRLLESADAVNHLSQKSLNKKKTTN